MGCKATLGELCNFHRGASVPRARMFNSGNYLYIHYGDLYRGFEQRIDVEDPAKPLPFILDSEKIKETQFLHDQDIVYVLTSETVDDLGHAFLFNNPRNRITVSGTETTIVRIQRKDMVLPAYLNYVMQSPRFIAELRQYVRGMKVFRVHPNDAARISIDLPSLDKQAKVVAILDAIFEKQLINNRLNGYLEELRKIIVSKEISCSIEREGSQWQHIPLKDVAQIQSGYSYKSAELVERSAIGMLGIKNFNRDGSYRSDGCKPIVPARAKASQFVELGEIIVAHTDLTQNADIIGRAIQVIDSGGYERMLASCDLVKVSSSDASISNELLAAMLQTEDFHNHCLGFVNGTTVLHLGKKALPEYMLKLPVDMQLRDRLELLFKSIAALQANILRENRALEITRDALLPKLMSGEIDVSKIDLRRLNSHLYVCALHFASVHSPMYHMRLSGLDMRESLR